MTESLDVNESNAGKRPTFLTVLCILTWIGSAWGIISSLFIQDPGLKEYAGYYYWVMLALNLGTLFGALQMWKLSKMGLYIWTACEVIAVVLMWVVVKGYLGHIMGDAVEASGMNDEMSAAFASAGTAAIESAMNFALILGSLFPALFIVLYWINAKHLK
ncbi:MAG: hypothetical protein EP338_12675 [Bacteroidetes bacterium]|nr:MAG: hypothetical protein EP338_12675 [Bacteroidota bacterium]